MRQAQKGSLTKGNVGRRFICQSLGFIGNEIQYIFSLSLSLLGIDPMTSARTSSRCLLWHNEDATLGAFSSFSSAIDHTDARNPNICCRSGQFQQQYKKRAIMTGNNGMQQERVGRSLSLSWIIPFTPGQLTWEMTIVSFILFFFFFPILVYSVVFFSKLGRFVPKRRIGQRRNLCRCSRITSLGIPESSSLDLQIGATYVARRPVLLSKQTCLYSFLLCFFFSRE